MIPGHKSAKRLITWLLRFIAHNVLNLEEKSKYLVVNKEGLIYGRSGEIIYLTLSMKH